MFLQNLVKEHRISLGQEAVATGFGRMMRPDDFTFATYRGHAHAGVPTRVPCSPSCWAGERDPQGQGRIDAPDVDHEHG